MNKALAVLLTLLSVTALASCSGPPGENGKPDQNAESLFQAVRHFLDDGTGDAIRQTVSGLEIQPEEPTPEEMAVPYRRQDGASRKSERQIVRMGLFCPHFPPCFFGFGDAKNGRQTCLEFKKDGTIL